MALPSIPRVMALLLSELDKEEVDLIKVSSLLAQDPVMTARLLRLSNSARFKLNTSISSVPEALAILGVLEVREMTYAAAVAGAFRHVGGVDMEKFWRYSLNTAKLMRRLAADRKTGVTAFTVGILHAIGELVIHRGLSREIAPLNAKVSIFSPQRAEAEHEFLGFSYAQVGAGFARAWNLPPMLVEVLEHHDAPFVRGSYEPMAGILHLAAWRCRAEEMGYSYVDLAETFPDTTALALKLDMDAVLERDPIEWTQRHEATAFSA